MFGEHVRASMHFLWFFYYLKMCSTKCDVQLFYFIFFCEQEVAFASGVWEMRCI